MSVFLTLFSPLGWHLLYSSTGEKCILPSLDTRGNYPVKSKYIFLTTSCTYTLYAMMYVFLGGIYSCFGVTSSVMEVMYALTLMEHTFYLFFFKYYFGATVDYGKYLGTASEINPIHVDNFPLYMYFIHVDFSRKNIH